MTSRGIASRASARRRTAPEGPSLARRVVELASEKKAQDLVILDLRELTTTTDFFVIGSALSAPHQKSLADHVLESLKHEGVRPYQVAGYPGASWILVDLVDVVLHLFRPEARSFYSLETLWGDAPAERFEDETGTAAAEARRSRRAP